MVGIPDPSYNECDGDALTLAATRRIQMTHSQTKETHSHDPRAKGPTSYGGACFCGAVQIRVTGQPVVMGYCHCQSCRLWSASPVNAFTLWKPEDLEVTKGQDQLGTHHKTERSERKWCKTCGGHVLTVHPIWGLVDVYVAVIPEFPFQAALHVNYGERVLQIVDGLPKQRDLPKEFGGSGTLLPE
jgi:hypothetical protein